MSMNLWHDIDLGSAEEFNAIVEVPHGSHNKYEIDKDTGLIALDRVNYGASAYPFNYCFIPQTLWDDGDAFDVMLIATNPIHPGILVKCRPVALMEMMDSGESDDKVIAVPAEDKRFDDIQDLKDLREHDLKVYQNFFETLKMLKGKKVDDYVVEVKGFKPKKDAIAAIERSIKMYKDKMAK